MRPVRILVLGALALLLAAPAAAWWPRAAYVELGSATW
jgi:hypothetical protein